MDNTRDDLAAIKSKADYIADIVLSYLAALDSDTPPAEPIPCTLAGDIRRTLENIADTLDPYCWPKEED